MEELRLQYPFIKKDDLEWMKRTKKDLWIMADDDGYLLPTVKREYGELTHSIIMEYNSDKDCSIKRDEFTTNKGEYVALVISGKNY